ncbi:MAG: hypothetical protein WDN49_01395 [Acetobacteraceae bacterium]
MRAHSARAAGGAAAPARGLGLSAATRTTCPYCGVGCGVEVLPGGAMRGDRRTRPISAGCARRGRRSARRWTTLVGSPSR